MKRNIFEFFLTIFLCFFLIGCGGKSNAIKFLDITYEISPELIKDEKSSEGTNTTTYTEKDATLDSNGVAMQSIMLMNFPMEDVDSSDADSQKSYFDTFIDGLSSQSGASLLKSEDGDIGEFKGKNLIVQFNNGTTTYVIRASYFYIDNTIYAISLSHDLDCPDDTDFINKSFEALIKSVSKS